MMELLSPAGDYKIAKAVLNAGADAVYVGGQFFNARAGAANLSEAELTDLLDYAHIHGKKVYLTVNILLKNVEYDRLYDYLRPYYEAGLDGVIVQDFGVVSFISRNFSELPIHASTQMTVAGNAGIRKLQQLGITRAVLPRELSLSDIKSIYDETGMELEVFAHGALCFCYSGQCLMSSVLGGRSGNRGQCAQPCRLTYDIYDSNGRKVDVPGSYVLSPKDLNTIELLPQLQRAGTASLKLEGRMKQLEYAAGITSIYRQQLDILYSEGEKGYFVSEYNKKMLFDLGNRCGFTDGYPKGSPGREMITYTEPAHRKGDSHEIAVSDMKLEISCESALEKDRPFSLKYKAGAYEVELKGDMPETACAKAVTADDIKKQAFKLGNTPFFVKDSDIYVQDGLFYSLSAVKELRQKATKELLDMMLSEHKRKASPEIKQSFSDIFAENSATRAVNVLVSEPSQLKAAMKYDFIDGFYVYPSMYEAARQSGKRVYVALPAVMDNERTKRLALELERIKDADGYLVNGPDGLGLLNELSINKGIRADYRFYNYSNETISFWYSQGIKSFTYPVELNSNELLHLNMPDAELVVYSRYPLMVTKQCLHKNTTGCTHIPQKWTIKDRKQMEFPVLNHCEYCYNEILNSLPTVLFDMCDLLPVASYRFEFKAEAEAEVKRVLDAYKAGECPDINYTRGHFKRGII